MVSSGDIINYTNLSKSWNESNVVINSRGKGSYIDGYWYINAPSFLVGTYHSHKFWGGDSNIIIYASYYDYNTGNWSAEELKTTNSYGSGDSTASRTVFWAHNAPDSATGITAAKHDTDTHFLWRVRQWETSNGAEKTIKIWGGSISIAGQTYYNNNLKSKPLKSCGIKTTPYTWSDGTTRSSKFIWVQSNWTQDDTTAISYFAARANRGTKITPDLTTWLCTY